MNCKKKIILLTFKTNQDLLKIKIYKISFVKHKVFKLFVNKTLHPFITKIFKPFNIKIFKLFITKALKLFINKLFIKPFISKIFKLFITKSIINFDRLKMNDNAY